MIITKCKLYTLVKISHSDVAFLSRVVELVWKFYRQYADYDLLNFMKMKLQDLA